VISPETIANDVKVLKGGDCCTKKMLIRVTSPENIANDVKVLKGGNSCTNKR
jgi:hypothetical protein